MRHLTLAMRVITISRVISRSKTTRRSIRQCARDFFARENHLEFAIEALVFGAVLVICAWPLAAAAGVIGNLL